MSRNSVSLNIPGTNQFISPGCRVRLGRFEMDEWEVKFGWYSFDNNRMIYGVYLVELGSMRVKPLLKTDLDDIYMVD